MFEATRPVMESRIGRVHGLENGWSFLDGVTLSDLKTGRMIQQHCLVPELVVLRGGKQIMHQYAGSEIIGFERIATYQRCASRPRDVDGAELT